MRIRTIFSLALAILVLALPTLAEAKKGDRAPGYVILNSGKKVEGKIITGSITDNEVKVQFLHPGKGKPTTYKPKDLEGYGYEATELDDLGRKVKRWLHYDRQKVDYPPKPFGPTTVFMEREIEGEITLYCYYIEVRNNPKKPYNYVYYIKGKDGKIEKINRENFRNITKNAFGNYTALSSRIGKKDFLYRNLDRMVRDYNYWLVNQHDRNEYRVAMKE